MNRLTHELLALKPEAVTFSCVETLLFPSHWTGAMDAWWDNVFSCHEEIGDNDLYSLLNMLIAILATLTDEQLDAYIRSYMI